MACAIFSTSQVYFCDHPRYWRSGNKWRLSTLQVAGEQLPHKTHQTGFSSGHITGKIIIYLTVHLCSGQPCDLSTIHTMTSSFYHCSIIYQFKSTTQPRLHFNQQFHTTSDFFANCTRHQSVFHKTVHFSCMLLSLPSLCTHSTEAEVIWIRGLLVCTLWLGEEGC